MLFANHHKNKAKNRASDYETRWHILSREFKA